MWTVFIADDEPKIRRRLTSLVLSFGDEFRICGEAADGAEALERIREELPDILLVDICMPRLNGLEFIERIGEDAQNCIVIVVTGHDEFDYAQRAVQLPIFEYVLKPVADDVLREILFRATEVLRERRGSNDLLQWAEQEVRRNRTCLLQELFDDWLHGFASSEEIEDRKRVLSLHTLSMARLLAVQLNARFYGGTAADLQEHEITRVAVRKLAEDALGGDTQWIHFEDRHERLFFVADGEIPESVGERIQKDARMRLNVRVRAEVSDCRLDYEGFIQDYEHICSAIDKRGRSGPFIRKFIGFMDDHFRNKGLSLAMAASALGLSPGYVSRLLKQHTGYSFSEFTNRYRVCKAIQLLSDDDKMMYEIADEVGYASQHYFSRIFKRITGLPPAAYRKEEGIEA